MDPQPTPTDAAALAALGANLARHRVDRGWTQAELAAEAGVGLRTVARLESGQSTQLTSLVRVLRALGLLERLGALAPASLASPLALLRAEKKVRRRAPRSRTRKGARRPWTWGEDAAAPAADTP